MALSGLYLISFNLFRNKDLEEVMDQLALERFDRFQLEQMVKKKGLRIGQRGNDATLSLFAGVTCIICCVSAQQFDHDLKRRKCLQWGSE